MQLMVEVCFFFFSFYFQVNVPSDEAFILIGGTVKHSAYDFMVDVG